VRLDSGDESAYKLLFGTTTKYANTFALRGFMKTTRALGVALALALLPVHAARAQERAADGVIVSVAGGFLKLQVVTDSVIRVAFAKDRAFFDRTSLATQGIRRSVPTWDYAADSTRARLTTAKLVASVDLATGAVSFVDRAGSPILAEGPREMTPADVQGEKTFHVSQTWKASADESLYGLGQHHLGLSDIKGYDVDLWQHNGTVAIPFLVSSRGYGIFWDNTSYTRFGDLRPWAAIPPAQLVDATGKAGGLTATYFADAHFGKSAGSRVDPEVNIYIEGDVKQPNATVHPALPPDGDWSARWEGQVVADVAGDYQFQTFSNDGVRMWIDGKLVVDHWRQSWLPWNDVARLRFEKGSRHAIKLEWSKDQGGIQAVQLRWKTPAPSADTSLWSGVGDGVDYYFCYGPEVDGVIAGYRAVTGEATLLPKWAFGLWQSRQRYNTSQESLDVLEGFRSRKIPVDVIVQDWFYWKEDQWGSHEFDATRFPDPDAWIRDVHDKYHAKLLISVWPKYYTKTKNFDDMQSKGYLYQPNLEKKVIDWVGYPDTFYDAFNAGARQAFWDQIKTALFDKKVDAWWLDASEPDLLPTPTLDGQRTSVHPTAAGTGSRVLNAYPLVHARGVFEGQRAAAPDQRVTILTRSSFAGLQHYGSATWSGDISSTWTAMRKQIAAGIGFSLSGNPYWSMDAGGFSVPARFSTENPKPEDLDEWRELNARWIEWAAFVPLFRIHGESPKREMWFFGGETSPAYQAMLKTDRLRYRMLPYVYSLAGAAAHENSTMLRPFVMDFRQDATARASRDEYMFGPAFLVAPVTTYKARNRSVYLPKAEWYDFWTGAATAGGRTVDAAAPYDAIPLFVRAGSIVPFGPELQYTWEKPADPMTVYVYTGADGAFTLYEDDGVSNAYERGQFTRIPFSWNEKAKALTIGTREGGFPGALSERTFHVVFVSKGRPAGFSFEPKVDKTVAYRGDLVTVRM
jgi:alpha-D-xyloside xylohydrolase